MRDFASKRFLKGVILQPSLQQLEVQVLLVCSYAGNGLPHGRLPSNRYKFGLLEPSNVVSRSYACNGVLDGVYIHTYIHINIHVCVDTYIYIYMSARATDNTIGS